MESFNFVATDYLNFDSLKDTERFVDLFTDFQTVTLNDEEELITLLNLLEIYEFTERELSSSDFSKYWDLSKAKFPEMNEEGFDEFYNRWLKASNRENNMDEYGNLIFLQGRSREWNKLKYRLIIKE